MKKLILLLLSACTAGSAWAQRSTTNSRQDSTGCVLTMAAPLQIDVSRDGKERQFPFVYRFGNDVFVSYSEHRDAVMASPADAMMISRDNGRSWTKKIIHEDFYITSMVQKGRTLYGVVYFTYPVSATEERMVYWTSKDRGNTWRRHEGRVKVPDSLSLHTGKSVWGSLLFHRGMEVLPDGTLQGVMYGHLGKEKKYTSVLVRSSDNCKSWHVVSVIAAGVPPDSAYRKAEGYCEPTLARVKDGSLLCVMRVASYLPLFQSRSLDQGRSWTDPVPLPGLGSTEAESVCPQLLLLKTGVLALSYGRPHDRIALSKDGSGRRWDCSTVSYRGETTGYSGIVEIAPGQVLQVSDQGRTGARQMAIWSRVITVGGRQDSPSDSGR